MLKHFQIIPGLSVAIDAATLLYFNGIKRTHVFDDLDGDPDLDVTVIIPAYNEEKWIKQCVESIFEQTKPPKKVIVVDDCSYDNTSRICRELAQEHEDLVYIRQDKRCGKAHNLNYAAQLISNQKELYSPITAVVDSDVVAQSDFIEQIQKPFVLEDVAAVSGIGAVIEPENFTGKLIASMYEFLFSFYGWQKNAQNYRNAVTPVCGGAVAYRTDILKKIPFPSRSMTEDTDHTWLLLENGYKVLHFPSARVEGEQARTFRGFFRQWFRWYSGTHQAWHIHGRKLLTAKKLLFTTLIPASLDGWMYSTWLLVATPLLFLRPIWLAIMIASDLGLTACLMAIFSRRGLKYLPGIWAMRFPLAITWLISGLKTLWERITNKRYLWNGKWERPDTRAEDALTKVLRVDVIRSISKESPSLI